MKKTLKVSFLEENVLVNLTLNCQKQLQIREVFDPTCPFGLYIECPFVKHRCSSVMFPEFVWADWHIL